jgi:predicted lipoprotein with Yx(FWY)xxD motif
VNAFATYSAYAGSGVNPKLIGTTRRRSGALQATYNGHPLYFYSGDVNPGDMHGENQYEYGGYWYAIGPAGLLKKPVVFDPGAY